MTQTSTAASAQLGARPVTRQFVNFACFKLDPAFRRLPDLEKEHARCASSPRCSPSRGRG